MMLFLVFFHRYHALSMIQNESDLLLHDIHNSICSAISSLLKSRQLFLMSKRGCCKTWKFWKSIFVQSERSLPSVRRHFWLLPDDFSKEIKKILLGNGCFLIPNPFRNLCNLRSLRTKTPLKCVFYKQVLQQPHIIDIIYYFDLVNTSLQIFQVPFSFLKSITPCSWILDIILGFS